MPVFSARWPAWALAALLGGCASFSPDAGFASVEQAAQSRLGKALRYNRGPADQEAIDRRVAELLRQPLGMDEAVQLALLNNRGLQAGFQELGIGDAERVQAGRLPNPGFSFGRLRRGSELELERGLHLNLARWLALPMLGDIEARRFQHTQGLVALKVLSLAADTRRAWVQALAAEEALRYARQVQQAAAAGAELARRMELAGNFNKLQRAREQGFAAEAALGLARAEQAQHATRERLIRLLGLVGEQTLFTLPERLPELPQSPLDLPDVESVALAQRLDVTGARLMAAQTAQDLGLTRTTRWVNVLEVGAVRNGSNEAPTQRGWELSLELPLFDWGGARVARAEAVYMQAVHRAAETAVNARSEVREAYGAYRSAYGIARQHVDEIVPLRKLVSEENLLRYNGMLVSVFELLADARAQIAAVNVAIEAKRDFWLAHAELELALVGKPSLAAALGAAAAAPAAAAGH